MRQNITCFRNLILSALVVFCLQHAAAQDIVHRMFGRDHGLPGTRIYQLLQDRKGFLWTCTDNGISRYDGNTFHTFGEKDGFPEFGAFHMYEDHAERLWFFTFSGRLVYYDQKAGQFCRFTQIHHPDMSDVRWMDEDAGGYLYFFTAAGSIFKWKADTVYRRIQANPNVLISGVCLSENELVVNDNSNIFRIKNFRDISKYNFIGGEMDLVRVGKAGKGRAISYNSKGIYLLGDSCIKVVTYNDNNRAACLSYFPEPNGDMWICTTNGLWLYEGGVFDEGHKKVYFKGKNVTSIICDFEGNYWVSIYGEGIAYCFSKKSLFYSFKNQDVSPQVALIAASGNTPYIFLASGEVFELADGLMKRTGRLQSAVSFQYYKNLAEFSNGDIWVTGSFGSYSIKHRKLIKFEDGSQSAILGKFANRFHGAYTYHCFDLKPGLRTLYRLTENGSQLVFSQSIRGEDLYTVKAMDVDRKGRCWLGTQNGLYYFDAHTPVTALSFLDSAFRSYVTDIWTDARDRVWVATRSNGILCLDNMKIAYHFTTANGLSTNNCGKILIDPLQDVWVCTNEGLNRIVNRQGRYGKIIRYTTQNVMPSNEVLCVKVIGDTVYGGTDKGLVRFQRGISIESVLQPKLYITSMRVSGKNIRVSDSSRVKYNESITIEFIGICFRDKAGLAYRYKLNGLDEQWHYTTSTKLEYSRLPPGTYHFILQVRNSTSGWGAATANFTLLVSPLYWQTIWFKVSLFLIGLLVIFGIVYTWLRARHKREYYNRKLVESQLKSLRLQINPHFIFNSINSIQDFIFSQNPEEANFYLSKFAGLMRMIVENSKKELVSLREENEFMNTYLFLERLRISDGFIYTISVDDDIDPGNIYIPPMILQPIVENAVKHGLMAKRERPELRIIYRMADDLLICTVEDNGVGREQAMAYRRKDGLYRTGVGIVNIEERLQLLNYKKSVKERITITDLYDAEGRGAGTRVEIILPLISHHAYSL